MGKDESIERQTICKARANGMRVCAETVLWGLREFRTGHTSINAQIARIRRNTACCLSIKKEGLVV